MKKTGLKTFEGVYTPTLLTILGVILYLRLGWVVGNVGLWGAIVIILFAHVITVCTALSMSSMLTNIKIGPGGAYAIISRSLGLEMGGAIGIPLYISQAVSIAFYIAGFSELWVYFFPSHSQLVIGIIAWCILTSISIISSRLAFKLQFFILAAVLLSLISFLTGPSLHAGTLVTTGSMQAAGFWKTFAIFFPAVTGILTGATMSGELENPRDSIIKGTLSAVFTGLGVYLFVAFWFARQAPQELLLSNTSIIFSLASVRFLVIAGVMGAVLSSALSTMVSAPRTLSALAENRVIPFGKRLSSVNQKGEPILAIIITAGISLAVIVLGNLDSLAELLTMFFLTTYAMINLVVFLEQVTGIISYRPTMSMSIFVPVVGAVGCLSVMLLINPLFTGITFFTVIAIYTLLKKKNLTSPFGDVRGGIFISIAEWAAQKAMNIPYHPRLWKPSVAIPIEHPDDFRRISRLVQQLIKPSGRLYYLTVVPPGKEDTQDTSVEETLNPLRAQQIYAQKVLVTSPSFPDLLVPTLQCLQSSFLPPNMILFTVSDNEEKRTRFNQLLDTIRPLSIAVCCLWLHPKYNLGMERNINLWLRDKSPNNDLAVLCALQFAKNFGAELTLLRVVATETSAKKVYAEMEAFIEEARLPANTKIRVLIGNFFEVFPEQHADLSLLGMPLKYEQMIELIESSNNSLLFLSSSGLENALI